MSETDPVKRLDAHAKAIRELRAKVRALEEQVEQLLAAYNPAAKRPAPVAVTPGAPWEMRPTCLSCGQPKELGRDRVVQCKACSEQYQAQTKRGYTGPKVLHDTCGYCGASKAPHVNPQCTDCRKGFAEWKAPCGRMVVPGLTPALPPLNPHR